MRKVLNIALVLTLAFAVSSAYACGEKKSSAEATATKADATGMNSGCVTDGAKVTTADAKADGCEAVSAKVTTTGAENCPVKESGMSKTSASSGCCAKGSAARMQKASLKSSDQSEASSSCHAPAMNEGAETKATKALESSGSKSNGMASAGEIAPDENTLK